MVVACHPLHEVPGSFRSSSKSQLTSLRTAVARRASSAPVHSETSVTGSAWDATPIVTFRYGYGFSV
jgi:hypothetical protein